MSGVKGSADNVFTRDQLREVSLALPQEWLTARQPRSAPAHSAPTVGRSTSTAGADELVLHGSTPELLGPTVAHYTEAVRGQMPHASASCL